MKVFLNGTIFIVSSIILFGCRSADDILYHDSQLKLQEYEIVDLVRNEQKTKNIKSNISNRNTKIINTICDPEEPKAIEGKIVSISVTEETPIVDVIKEVARISGTDIQIDPTITGGVNLNLKNKPLRYMFNRICGLTDTRYEEKHGVIIFSKDLPYAKSYDIDFLDVVRSASSSITLNTSGLSSSSNSIGNGISTISTKSNDTFWDDIVKDIEQIIETTENTNNIYTKTAEKIQKAAQEEREERKIQEDINNGIYNKLSSNNKSQNKNDTQKQDEKKITSKNRIRTNKRAGLIIVTASRKSHDAIEKYLVKVKRKIKSQVLIEYRIFEISLNREYATGIDWNKVRLGQIATGMATIASGIENEYGNIFTLTFNKSIDAVAKAFEKFGSIRTLANPRITASNNQPAFMTLSKNYVYFKTKSTYTPAAFNGEGIVITPAYRNIESEAKTMPIGIIMYVLPSINEKNEIMLSIKPTISKLDSTVQDPAVTILLDESDKDKSKMATNSSIPVANVQEFDTILKLSNGQSAVIGGFTERNSKTTSTGIPYLKNIPIFGFLFKKKEEITEMKEMVMIIRVTIVENGKRVDQYDKRIYDTFSDDPRLDEI